MIQQPKKILEQVRGAIRQKHYACSTEKTKFYWAKCFVLSHDKSNPLEMASEEISEFVTHLAVEQTNVGNVDLVLARNAFLDAQTRRFW